MPLTLDGPGLPWRRWSLDQAPGKVGVIQGEDGRLQGRIWGGAPSSGLRGQKERLVHRTGGRGGREVRGGINGVREGQCEEGEKISRKVEEAVNLAWRRLLGAGELPHLRCLKCG